MQRWSSGWGFLLAASGSAVGFGNLLKFPAALWRGGGAFLLLYLGFVLLMGWPLLRLELAAGQRAGGGPTAVMGRLALLPLLACFFSLAYYLRLGGWCLSLLGGLAGLPLPAPLAAAGFGLLTLWARGGGAAAIERCSRAAMPLLLALLGGAAVWGVTRPGSAAALRMLLRCSPADLPGQLLPAAGQAFFSLSLGMGVMLVYGAYLPEGVSLTRAAGTVCLVDTLCALLAALALLPAGGGAGAAGDAAFFWGMERLLSPLPFGGLLAALGLVTVLLAALTSSVGMADCLLTAGARRDAGTQRDGPSRWDTGTRRGRLSRRNTGALRGLLLLVAALPAAAPFGMEATEAGAWLPFWIDRVLLPVAEAGLLWVLLEEARG